MKTKDEIKQWLLENAVDEYGTVDLSYLDFGDRNVYNNHQKAKEINNDYQEAEVIFNDGQKAKVIYNGCQKADVIDNAYQKAQEIDNDGQEANVISNYSQVSKTKYEAKTKEELIAKIKELENEDKRRD